MGSTDLTSVPFVCQWQSFRQKVAARPRPDFCYKWPYCKLPPIGGLDWLGFGLEPLVRGKWETNHQTIQTTQWEARNPQGDINLNFKFRSHRLLICEEPYNQSASLPQDGVQIQIPKPAPKVYQIQNSGGLVMGVSCRINLTRSRRPECHRLCVPWRESYNRFRVWTSCWLVLFRFMGSRGRFKGKGENHVRCCCLFFERDPLLDWFKDKGEKHVQCRVLYLHIFGGSLKQNKVDNISFGVPYFDSDASWLLQKCLHVLLGRC